MILAAAQTVPVKGNVEKNIENHLFLIKQAHKKGVDLIVFPELSLTGYEPELASSLAFSENDPRIKPFFEIARDLNMIILVGAPINLEDKLHIASFIVYPDSKIEIYTKRYLHPGEEKYFHPGKLNPQIGLNGQVASLAICADISNPQHPEDAYNKGASLYLSSVLCSQKGYDYDVNMLRGYAKKYNMLVMMSNFGGDSGGYDVAGKSILISKDGETISCLKGKGEGLAIAKYENEKWVSL
jgi:predicted amidohydrolase